MKKVVLCILFLAGCAVVSKAQKGSILVYGIMDIHTEKEPNKDKTTGYAFNPGVGYQFSKKWTAGIAGGYGQEKFTPKSGDQVKTTNYRAGGFLRYTHEFNEIFSIYGQGDVYYLGTKEQEIKSNGFGVDLIPTIGINVSNGFALNISFGGISYETIKEKDASDGTNTFDIDFGKDISIGISKKFCGAKCSLKSHPPNK